MHITFIAQLMKSFKVKHMPDNLFKNLPRKSQNMRVAFTNSPETLLADRNVG